MIAKTKPVPVEKVWLIPCGELPLLEGEKLSDALYNHTEVTAMYHKCRDKHNALINSVINHNKNADLDQL